MASPREPKATAPEGAEDGAADRRANRLEWVAAGVAGLVVVWMVGALLWEAFAGARLPPDLVVTLEPPVLAAGGQHLRFTVANRGGRAASAVGVALRAPGDPDATRRVTIDYVPARSEATGGFVLGPDAQAEAAIAFVEGYVDP